MFKNDKRFHFLATAEYTRAPILGTWNRYYYALAGIFISEVILFSFLSSTY